MQLKTRIIGCAAVAVFFAATPSLAANYSFNVLYNGGGSASLLAGDDPTATTMVSSDTFSWNIQVAGASFWDVINGGDFFPLMAFSVNESGRRTGDFTLSLRNDGGEVFSLTELGSVQQYAHVGTNTVTLGTGLKFDEMQLNYSLTDSSESPDLADPLNLLQIGTSPNGLLPFFGAPEFTAPGNIVFVSGVPEPESYAMMLAGLGLLGFAARRRKQQAA